MNLFVPTPISSPTSGILLPYPKRHSLDSSQDEGKSSQILSRANSVAEDGTRLSSHSESSDSAISHISAQTSLFARKGKGKAFASPMTLQSDIETEKSPVEERAVTPAFSVSIPKLHFPRKVRRRTPLGQNGSHRHAFSLSTMVADILATEPDKATSSLSMAEEVRRHSQPGHSEDKSAADSDTIDDDAPGLQISVATLKMRKEVRQRSNILEVLPQLRMLRASDR
ncbi:hypothetical protein WOLCODRAFT_145322 [Wolfiporia cocos MD-104 SS10]|uniref:Uncharacterized protein n=1 Tax=Wolfiporia cocos (strain MD-104) TaxID=742152 RepID=A0A2H3JSG7_WOLCO|nr:hypothetical protein WOLCODRAFT_145322 [Wolfiporia cocos MD-104 SS10]